MRTKHVIVYFLILLILSVSMLLEYALFSVRGHEAIAFLAGIAVIGCLCGIACWLSRVPGRTNLFAYLGLPLTSLATPMCMFWVINDDYDWFIRATVCVTAFTFASVHACLLSIARLSPKFSWLYYLAVSSSYCLASAVSILAFPRPHASKAAEANLYKASIILAILAAAFSLIIPLLHFMQRRYSPTDGLTLPLESRSLGSIDEEISQLKSVLIDLQSEKHRLLGESQNDPANRLLLETEASFMQRFLTYVLIISILIATLLGVVMVLRDHAGWLYEIKVFLSVSVLILASLGGLACLLSHSPEGNNLLPKIGLVLVLCATPPSLFLAWVEDKFIYQHLLYYRITLIICAFAVATVSLCLLSLARLSKKQAWVFQIAILVAYGLALLFSYSVFLIDGPTMEDRQYLDQVERMLYGLGVAGAALTFIIPLLHLLNRWERTSQQVDPQPEFHSVSAINQEIAKVTQEIIYLEQMKASILGGRS